MCQAGKPGKGVKQGRARPNACHACVAAQVQVPDINDCTIADLVSLVKAQVRVCAHALLRRYARVRACLRVRLGVQEER